MGPSFLFPDVSSSSKTESLSSSSSSVSPSGTGFRNVALSSILPRIAAELINAEEKTKKGEPIQECGAMEDESGAVSFCNKQRFRDEEGDRNKEEEGEWFDAQDAATGSVNHGTMRMLRDVFLAKDDEEFICGWHVDDTGYWPSTSTSPGINAWIAIDSMPSTLGGGFALSVGSHTSEWGRKAREVLLGRGLAVNQVHSEGVEDVVYENVEDMFRKGRGAGTCNLASADHVLNKRAEAGKRVYDVEAGDVVFHTRWLFHRTVPFGRELVKENRKRVWRELSARKMKRIEQEVDDGDGLEDDDVAFLLEGDSRPLLHRRYSVRYAPGNAVLPRGFGTEYSTLYDPSNQGQTLDDVDARSGPWYPLCHPTPPDANYVQRMRDLVKTKLPIAEERRRQATREMAPFLREIAKSKTRIGGNRGSGEKFLNTEGTNGGRR